MEILFIIIAICLSIVGIMFACIRINELEQQIAMLQKKQINIQKKTNEEIDLLSDGLGKWINEFADNNSKFYEDIKQLKEEVDKVAIEPLDYKNEVMKSAKAYIYLEMCYIKNQISKGNIDTSVEHLKQESAGDLYSKDLLTKGDMIDHE